MRILYSNILPLGTKKDQVTIADCFHSQLSQADQLEIAVGYISKASLAELERLVEANHISKICLTIGMYYIDGMPESSYHSAIRINNKWQENNIGEIRIVKAFKYHGKLYCFYKNGQVFSSIIGSANLGVIKPEANNRRQYEVATLSDNIFECRELSSFIKSLNDNVCSANIADVIDLPLIREANTSLASIDSVIRRPTSDVEFYMQQKISTHFILPIKVPDNKGKFIDDGKHFTKSNINVCYAAPRNKRKPRDWFETQLTVSKAISRSDGYPKKNKTFFVITDDGYWFKAHTTSDGNKQFSAVGDELILGRWIKGRLAAAGLVIPVNDTQQDIHRTGMITKEMLEAYGCNSLLLSKTNQKASNEDGELLDVWILSFESENAI